MSLQYMLVYILIACVYVSMGSTPDEGRILKQADGSPLPEAKYYDLQKVDHFDGSNREFWKQRYFVNATFHKPGGPIFLMQGGHEALNPVWIVNGSWAMYAKTHGALMVLLEHRYYGFSRPVKNLDVHNMRYLSSRQALADLAKFISDFRLWNQLPDNKIILFGGGYAGALVTWFRSKYPYMSDGAVASSAPLVAVMDFKEYFEAVGAKVEDDSELCNAEIMTATNTLSEWWGQPDKRVLMHSMFRLCDKINYAAILDYTVFFYKLATENFGYIVQNDGTNRDFLGAPATNISTGWLCGMMTDEELGTNIERYAKINSMMLDLRGERCLDISYVNLAYNLNYTGFNNSRNDGRRQWLYQRCTELGWAKDSWSRKQPFGNMWLFPANFTFDQCLSAFAPLDTGYFGIEDDTNLYYGGRDLTVSRIVFVNGQWDPWNTLGATKPLKNSPDAEIINIEFTAHKADMYPPLKYEYNSLFYARKRISELIGKWVNT